LLAHKEGERMTFEFATAQRIVFGDGVAEQAGVVAATLGHNALIVAGSNRRHIEPLQASLAAAGVANALFTVGGEPDVATVAQGVVVARESQADLVIGIGGGSVVDAGKAIAALATNQGDIYDYLEVIGRAQPLLVKPLPFIAAPTTAGTGSEVTRNAVLASPEHKVKVSLRSAAMLPCVALVDPLLTHSLPPAQTAASGLDALTQLIEPFVSSRANPLVDAICKEGIAHVVRALRRAFVDGSDAEARREMAFASLCSGLALANAGLGAVHGFAGPFGGTYGAPHGAVCAALLAPVFAANARALAARAPHSPLLDRFRAVAVMLTGRADATPDDAVVWLQSLTRDLAIPSLSTYGYHVAHATNVVKAARAASSMKANPLLLTDDELYAILAAAA